MPIRIFADGSSSPRLFKREMTSSILAPFFSEREEMIASIVSFAISSFGSAGLTEERAALIRPASSFLRSEARDVSSREIADSAVLRIQASRASRVEGVIVSGTISRNVLPAYFRNLTVPNTATNEGASISSAVLRRGVFCQLMEQEKTPVGSLMRSEETLSSLRVFSVRVPMRNILGENMPNGVVNPISASAACMSSPANIQDAGRSPLLGVSIPSII